MIALTVREPWATATVFGDRRVDNRGGSIPKLCGERVAIHVGVQITVKERDAMPVVHARLARAGLHPEAARRMAMLAVAKRGHGVGTLIGIVLGVATIDEWIGGPTRAHELGQGQWFTGPIAAVFSDVRPVVPPVPCPGARRFWRLPPDIALLVNQRIKEPASCSSFS